MFEFFISETEQPKEKRFVQVNIEIKGSVNEKTNKLFGFLINVDLSEINLAKIEKKSTRHLGSFILTYQKDNYKKILQWLQDLSVILPDEQKMIIENFLKEPVKFLAELNMIDIAHTFKEEKLASFKRLLSDLIVKELPEEVEKAIAIRLMLTITLIDTMVYPEHIEVKETPKGKVLLTASPKDRRAAERSDEDIKKNFNAVVLAHEIKAFLDYVYGDYMWQLSKQRLETLSKWATVAINVGIKKYLSTKAVDPEEKRRLEKQFKEYFKHLEDKRMARFFRKALYELAKKVVSIARRRDIELERIFDEDMRRHRTRLYLDIMRSLATNQLVGSFLKVLAYTEKKEQEKHVQEFKELLNRFATQVENNLSTFYWKARHRYAGLEEDDVYKRAAIAFAALREAMHIPHSVSKKDQKGILVIDPGKWEFLKEFEGKLLPRGIYYRLQVNRFVIVAKEQNPPQLSQEKLEELSKKLDIPLTRSDIRKINRVYGDLVVFVQTIFGDKLDKKYLEEFIYRMLEGMLIIARSYYSPKTWEMRKEEALRTHELEKERRKELIRQFLAGEKLEKKELEEPIKSALPDVFGKVEFYARYAYLLFSYAFTVQGEPLKESYGFLLKYFAPIKIDADKLKEVKIDGTLAKYMLGICANWIPYVRHEDGRVLAIMPRTVDELDIWTIPERVRLIPQFDDEKKEEAFTIYQQWANTLKEYINIINNAEKADANTVLYVCGEVHKLTLLEGLIEKALFLTPGNWLAKMLIENAKDVVESSNRQMLEWLIQSGEEFPRMFEGLAPYVEEEERKLEEQPAPEQPAEIEMPIEKPEEIKKPEVPKPKPTLTIPTEELPLPQIEEEDEI